MPLIQQYETVKGVLDKIGISQLVVAPHEADDIIGTLTSRWREEKAGTSLIYSNDKDLLQLLNNQTSQIIAQKKQEIIYTVDKFKEDYGIETSQWVDVKALLGDSSDNIPGCPGVGEKSALPLIQQYHSVENLYDKIDGLDKKFNRYKKKLIEGRESTMLSKELATIMCNLDALRSIDLEALRLNIKEDRLSHSLEELELNIKVQLPLTS